MISQIVTLPNGAEVEFFASDRTLFNQVFCIDNLHDYSTTNRIKAQIKAKKRLRKSIKKARRNNRK